MPCITLHAQDHVMDIKLRLLASQAAAVEEERRAGNSRLAAKQVSS